MLDVDVHPGRYLVFGTIIGNIYIYIYHVQLIIGNINTGVDPR